MWTSFNVPRNPKKSLYPATIWTSFNVPFVCVIVGALPKEFSIEAEMFSCIVLLFRWEELLVKQLQWCTMVFVFFGVQVEVGRHQAVPEVVWADKGCHQPSHQLPERVCLCSLCVLHRLARCPGPVDVAIHQGWHQRWRRKSKISQWITKIVHWYGRCHDVYM